VDVVISEEENLKGEIRTLDQKCALAGIDFDIGLCKQIHGVVK
jgi:hypothetical protein